MGEQDTGPTAGRLVKVIDLSEAPGERDSWGRPSWLVYLWGLAELVFVTNPIQISSRLRVAILRKFGAKIGQNVIFRPRTRVRFPWKLEVGDRCWIGEGVWIHNQDVVTIGSDVVISQDAFITTGSHRIRHDMGLITKPIRIEDGAWVTSRAILLGGCSIGRSSIIYPGTVVPANSSVGPNLIVGRSGLEAGELRFPDSQFEGESRNR